MGWKVARLGLGILLIVAGLAILGIGLLSYFDDPGKKAQPLPLAFTDYSIYDRPVNNSQVIVPTATPKPEQPPLVQEISYYLIIDKIGVNAPVVVYSMDENNVPQVPLNGTDVAWYDFSANPGTGSNAVFAGHVNWNYVPAVFGNLRELNKGDSIKLVAEDGTELVYSVSDNFLVDPEDPASLKVMGPTSTDTITLITCGGTWEVDPGEQFGGDYTNRVIVRATLVKINAA